MTDILLISLPFKYKNLEIVAPICPHLGLLLLASYLEKNGFSVEIMEAQALGYSYDDIRREIEKKKPNIIGLTGVSAEFPVMKEIAEIIRSVDPNIKIVAGGPHVTIMPETIENKTADYIVIGEGEITFAELCGNILRGPGSVEDVAGLIYFKDGIQVRTGHRKPIENLNDMPGPAWHLVPMEKFENYGMWDEGLPFITYISSRGCPFNCIFCTSSNVFGHKYRALPPERVVDDIEFLYKKYGKRYVYFQDDEFTINKERAVKICELIAQRKLPMRFACLGRVSDIDDRLLSAMKKANWAVIAFGAECGYPEGLEQIQKKITLLQIENAVNLCNRYGIMNSCSFVIGFPWEDAAAIKKTIAFAKKLKTDMFYFQILTPYPGTPLYGKLKEEGLLADVRWEDYVQHSITGTYPLLRTRFLLSEQLKYWNNRAHFEVFFSPAFILRKLSGLRSFVYLKRGLYGAFFLIKSIFGKRKK